MKITLAKIRSVLESVDCGITTYVRTVYESKDVATAQIDTSRQCITYNPEFVKKFVKTNSDLFCLLMHELMHPMLGHYMVEGQREVTGIACDAIINNMVRTLFEKESNGGSLFKRFYKNPTDPSIILSGQCSRIQNHTRFVKFGRAIERGEVRTTLEAIRVLWFMLPKNKYKTVILIGTHGKGDGEVEETSGMGGCETKLPDSLNRAIGKALAGKLKTASGLNAGWATLINNIIVEASRKLYSLKNKLIYNFKTKRKVDKFMSCGEEEASVLSPIPIAPSRKDLVLLAADFYPMYFHNRQIDSVWKKDDLGLAIYLDVSGSVNQDLPDILAALKLFSDKIESIYLFSNKVVETSMDDLAKGRIATTYGTDFDCIAQSIIKNDYSKAVIFTDGWASMDDNNKYILKSKNVSILTIVFGRGETDIVLKNFGPVLYLEDIITLQ